MLPGRRRRSTSELGDRYNEAADAARLGDIHQRGGDHRGRAVPPGGSAIDIFDQTRSPRRATHVRAKLGKSEQHDDPRGHRDDRRTHESDRTGSANAEIKELLAKLDELPGDACPRQKALLDGMLRSRRHRDDVAVDDQLSASSSVSASTSRRPSGSSPSRTVSAAVNRTPTRPPMRCSRSSFSARPSSDDPVISGLTQRSSPTCPRSSCRCRSWTRTGRRSSSGC